MTVLPYNQHNTSWTTFHITNPDCEEPIDLHQLSIIRADGTVIYEGPFVIRNPGLDFENKTADVSNLTTQELPTLGPHVEVVIVLHLYMAKDPAGSEWYTHDEALDQFGWPYTVEVFWSGKGLPLAGYAEHHNSVTEGVLMRDTAWGSPMVNMKQN